MRNLGDFRRLANQSGGNLQIYISACGAIDPSESTAFLQAWNEYTSSQNKVNTPSQSSSGSVDIEPLKKIQNLSQSVQSYKVQDSEMIQASEIIDGVQSLISGTFGDGGLFGKGNFGENLKNVGSNFLKSMLTEVTSKGAEILTQERDLHNQINSKIGISGELSRRLRTEIVETLPQMISMGYGFEDVKDTITGMIEEQGKFTLYNREVIGDMAVTSRAFVGDLDTLGKMIGTYEKTGFGAADALDKINQAGTSSISLGLNARKVVSEIETNMKNLNQYGFKNGFDGLTRMVQKSIEFKMSMQNVFTLAEKLFDPDQAIGLSANLQAIGGAIGDFNDPLKLMYMATNDAGGLQEAMIGVAGSLATYNSELGKFEITGVNLRKARALAGELGMSMDELSTTAIKAAERTSASADLLAGGFNLDEKQQEFITNLSRMEGGKMVIDVPQGLFGQFGNQTRVALDELNREQVQVLLNNQEVFEKMSAKDIALEQYTEMQKIGLNVSEIVTMMKVDFASGVRGGLSKVDEYLKNANEILNETKSGQNEIGQLLTGKKGELKSSGQKFAEDFFTTKKVEDAIIRPNQKDIIIPSINDTIYAIDETKNRGGNVVGENKKLEISINSNVNADAIRNEIMNQIAMTSDYREYIGTFS